VDTFRRRLARKAAQFRVTQACRGESVGEKLALASENAARTQAPVRPAGPKMNGARESPSPLRPLAEKEEPDGEKLCPEYKLR